jgi:uncharacterized DUF497 family protein
VAGPEFDWDGGNVRHLARHAVRPVEAEEVILDPAAIMLEIEIDDEERVKAIGRTKEGRILVAVFTFRGEAIRPITAYDATKRDREVYLRGELV